MSAKLRAVEPVIELSPLDRARERVTELNRQLDAVNAQIARAENSSSPVETVATTAQGLRQRLKAIFARMLTAGKLDTGEPEVVDLTIQLAAAEGAERQSAAIQEARRGVVADLQSKAADLHSQLAVAQRSLTEANLDALHDKFDSTVIPNLRRSNPPSFADIAMALGYGRASCELCRRAREQHGITRQQRGVERPIIKFDLPVVGLGIADCNRTNIFQVDIEALTEAAFNKAMSEYG